MIARILDGVIVVLGAVLLLIAATGGVDLELGVLRLRLHDWIRPAALLGLAAMVRGFVWRSHPSRPSHLSLLALLLAVAGMYALHHVRVAGGLDSYGYVSTAHRIASGRLREAEPLAEILPFENAIRAAAPLGHVAGPDGRSSVPRFPLGLPLVMALFTVFGPAGPFFVPLVMAYGAVAIAYRLALDRSASPDRAIGLFAAVLVAVDPLFASSAIQPMSDVPATFWMLAAVWLALGQSRRSRHVAAGLCAGMALLTRPVLLPAIFTLVLVSADTRKLRQILPLAATVAVFIAVQLVMNAMLYGGPTMSGYGTTSHMFEVSASRAMANASSFGRWLTYSHTPLFWLLWPGALYVLRRDRWAWQVSAIAAAAAAPYLFYMVFDDWQASRFLLPAIVLVLILFARAVARLVYSPTHPSHLTHLTHLIVLAAAFACAISSHVFLRREGIYTLPTLEAKYALVGEWFKTNTSERAVVLAGLHSGTIRMYGGRATVRWDEIPEHALGAALRALIDAGYEPFLALDLPTEPPLFGERFIWQASGAEPIARVRVVTIYRFVSAY